MRFAVILSFLLFFSSMLEASYARSIRVGSFITKADANRALIELNQFIESNDRLVEIQENQGFETKVIKTGKYYMHNLQPFTNKQLVQETLDILRTKYEYVYPRKIKFKPSYLKAAKSSYTRDYEEERYEAPKRYVAPEVYEAPKRVERTSIDREKLIKKIDNVLQNNEQEDRNIRRESNQKYPELNLDLPTLKYTFLQKKSTESKTKKDRTLHDSASVPMTLFRNYMYEILIAGFIIIFLLLIAIFYKSKKSRENRITIQEIYN